MRIYCHMSDPDYSTARSDIRIVFGVWHEALITPVYTYSRQKTAMIVSTHRDGELLVQMLEHLGAIPIRGSSTRGGVAAVLGALREKNGNHFAITPDGPKGPRRVAKKGAIYLASRGQMPLVASGLAIDRCWRLGSWDKMMIPKPFSKAYIVYSEPLHIPAELTNAELDEYLKEFQNRLEKMQEIADRLAAGEKLDLPLVDWKQTLIKTEQ